MQVREVSKTRVAYKAPAQRPVNSQARLLTLSSGRRINLNHLTIYSVNKLTTLNKIVEPC
jgi:hypothetical protein